MKNWNTPVVEEININETAHGICCADFETCILFHDDTPCGQPDKKPETPVTPNPTNPDDNTELGS